MKSTNAKALNEFLFLAIKSFEVFCANELNQNTISNEDKDCWGESCFEAKYQAFLAELVENIFEYKDSSISYHYVNGCLGDCLQWSGFPMDEVQRIFNNAYEPVFLFKLKQCIETYIHHVVRLLSIGMDSYSDNLQSFYNKTLLLEQSKTTSENEEIAPFDDRFDFVKFRKECESLPTTHEKIKFINNRLFDLKQWEMEYVEGESKNGKKYKMTSDYYPNFEERCEIELERFTKLLEIESKLPLQIMPVSVIEKVPEMVRSGYKWNSTDTNLLELLTTLHLENCITRDDGKELTRKELIGFIGSLFGLEIKDVEGKLNKATNRNDKTPFLDRLRTAFHVYSREKDEKLRVRT